MVVRIMAGSGKAGQKFLLHELVYGPYPEEDREVWEHHHYHRRYPLWLGICKTSKFESFKAGLEYVYHDLRDSWPTIELKFGASQWTIENIMKLLGIKRREGYGKRHGYKFVRKVRYVIPGRNIQKADRTDDKVPGDRKQNPTMRRSK